MLVVLNMTVLGCLQQLLCVPIAFVGTIGLEVSPTGRSVCGTRDTQRLYDQDGEKNKEGELFEGRGAFLHALACPGVSVYEHTLGHPDPGSLLSS